MADLGEIFLLDVGLVVLFVGSRAGPFDVPFALQEIGFDDCVEEFAAAVALERRQFGPTAVEVGECQAPEERSTTAAAAMRDGVGFEGAVVGLVAVHPERQDGLEALVARLLAVLPDILLCSYDSRFQILISSRCHSTWRNARAFGLG